MGLVGPHDIGTEFILRVLSESQKVWLAHAKAQEGLIKTRAGPRGTMVWALWELQLHQQAQRQGLALGRPRIEPAKRGDSASHCIGAQHTPHNAHLHTQPSRLALPVCKTIPAIAFS